MKAFFFVSALAISLTGIVVTRFDAVLADCSSPPGPICAWHSDPTEIDALGNGLFADDLVWEWYIPGTDAETGTVFLEWDELDADDDNIDPSPAPTFTPAYILTNQTLCTDSLESTLQGYLLDPDADGVIAIEGNVHHHTTQLCTTDKNISVNADE